MVFIFLGNKILIFKEVFKYFFGCIEIIFRVLKRKNIVDKVLRDFGMLELCDC